MQLPSFMQGFESHGLGAETKKIPQSKFVDFHSDFLETILTLRESPIKAIGHFR